MWLAGLEYETFLTMTTVTTVTGVSNIVLNYTVFILNDCHNLKVDEF